MERFFDWYLWYYIFLAIMAYFYAVQRNKFLADDNNNLLRDDGSKEEYKVGIFFAILVFLPLILLAGYRGWDFARKYGDTGGYIGMFQINPSSISEALETIDWDSKYPGFILFIAIIKQFISNDYRVFFIIVASIQGLSLAIIYRYYRTNIILSAFLFFASTEFLSWMMNGMRQFLVVAILFLIFPLLQKKKYIQFIIIVLLLFTVHRSALVAIPLYFASLGKPFNKKTLIIIILCMAAIAFTGQFTNLMDDGLQDTAYSNMVSEFEGDDGTNIFRALVYSVPAIIAIINLKKIDDNTPDIINISINMSLITAGLYFLSVPISGIYMGRLPIYCSLFSYILLPWEIKHFYREDMYKIILGAMIVLYFLYYSYQVIEWGL